MSGVKLKVKKIENKEDQTEATNGDEQNDIPLELRKQGSTTNCTDVFIDTNCPCSGLELQQLKRAGLIKPINYTDKRSLIPLERLNDLRKKVQEAIKLHKVFTIRGCFYTIRKALVQRGWVEKLDIHRRTFQSLPSNLIIEDLVQQLPIRRPGESRRQHIAKCERNVMSRLLEYIAVDFLWTCRKEKSDWVDMARNPSLVINKVNKVPYTSKEGLCTTLRDFHWYYEEGMSETYFPRCFNVWNPEELTDFIENFRMTACISMIRWLVETFNVTGIDSVASGSGKVPITSIHFALNRCTEYLNHCLHYDIDSDESIRIWEHDWDVFLTHHYLVTHENARILLSEDSFFETVLKSAQDMLNEMKIYWPQYNIDGQLNVWIVKPGNRCRGRGIQIMNNIKQIVALVNPQIVTKTRYVVQKYIERPLIIHNTKFDIRQWFMVTSVQPLAIWMYKESYLRFSSQEYNLLNYHESVHLTNHAIQKKYVNGVRDERLPQENMWDCHTFQAYLRQIGKMKMWNERIYPGMQRAIIGTMLASQENMDRRPNTFELFGADFMICEDFYPWLIEINSSPDLGATTSVTARLCPQCLEDTVKVVIDRRANPTAETGSFELIYKQSIPPAPAYMGLNLFLKGQQILPKGGIKKDKFRDELKAVSARPSIYHISKGSLKITQSNSAGPVIVDFMECLNKSGFIEGLTNTNGVGNNGVFGNGNSKKTATMVLKKHNFPATNINKIQTTTGRYLTSSSLHRLPTNSKLKENYFKNLRHTSCGPIKYTQTQQQQQQIEELISPKESESVGVIPTSTSNSNKKELECVGSKCLENGTNGDGGETVGGPISSSSSSSRKPSLENLFKSKSAILLGTRHGPGNVQGKLRSIRNCNYRSKFNGNGSMTVGSGGGIVSSVSQGNLAEASGSGTITTATTATENKIISSFAVGMSLRAWRAKYNKLLKNQKENLHHVPVMTRSFTASPSSSSSSTLLIERSKKKNKRD